MIQPVTRPVRAGELEVTEREQGGVRVIHVAGELDLSTAPALCLQLESARRVADAQVLVDLERIWSSATPPACGR